LQPIEYRTEQNRIYKIKYFPISRILRVQPMERGMLLNHQR
jgi:hypothetical protein